jgi:hypothetical protein
VSGARGSIEIATSPVNLDETQRRLAEFLGGSDRHVRLYVVSNWKVGVLVPSLIAIPGVLILLAVAWDIGMTARRFVSGDRAVSRTGG